MKAVADNSEPEVTFRRFPKAPDTTVVVMPAIRYEGRIFALPRPSRHNDIIRRIDGDGEQGFVTNKGDFLDREEAWWVAAVSGQVDRSEPRELFTEDLW